MAACFCLSLLSGCGGGASLAYVKGTVTQGGKPLAGVAVTFTQTEKNFSAAGLTNDSGAFVLVSQSGKAGAMPGKNKVTLTIPSAGVSQKVDMSNPDSVEQMRKMRDTTLQGGRKGAPAQEKKPTSIPAEYSNPNKTPLEYEVTTGSNDFDIPIP